ncbi:MAG: hypothetical protein II954_06020 [Synergistaceae bacterium]|nr:hypothetical protein [Synergistaceae bacterium]
MGLGNFFGRVLEHGAEHMANTYERYSRDSRLSDEKREELADAADRLHNFSDKVHQSRNRW